MKRSSLRLSAWTFPSFTALAVITAVSVSGAPAAAEQGTLPDAPGRGSAAPSHELLADTWVAADALGRVLPGAEACGPPRPGKVVAIFYWTWHLPKVNPGVRGAVYDNSRIIGAALAEGRPPRWPGIRANHFWGEPELGYYRTTDRFVLRKHASMLADAGVDVIVFDTTNPPFTWKEGYMALCREFSAMRREGNRTPSIAFMCPFGDPTVVVERVFKELYRPGLFADLWFRWEGKPLILANPRYFRKKREIREFFTFRAPIPGYWTRPAGPDQWPWLQVYPQHGFPDATGRIECVAVGVAQNAIPGYYGPAPMSHRKGAMGRSWHDGARDPNIEAVLYGPNFREQWGRALELDPRVVFVTGWNEWTAARLPKFGPFNEHDDAVYPGGLFIDEYDPEYSRDIEPMKGGFGDSYYYQLVAWVRMFKGVRRRPLPAGPSVIRIDGRFDDWTGVRPEFRDTVGDTLHRREPGYDGQVYVNNTGRNDIVRCKVAYDADSLYFFVETRRALTPASDRNWMLLFVDADQDPATGWNGYDFLINGSRNASTHRASVVRLSASTIWREEGRADFRTAGNRLELRISRAVLGLEGAKRPAIDFHWADNIQRVAVEEFGVNGDSAPNRRFNYRFGSDPAPAHRRAVGYFPRDLRRGESGRVVVPPPTLRGLPGAWWIWRTGVPDPAASAPVETVRFRRRLTVAALGKGDGAFMAAAVDDLGEVFVNGASCGVLTGWTPPAVFPIPLRAGDNLIEIVVKNAGDAPNPAGLAAEIAVKRSDGSTAILARTGDGKWEAVREGPGSAGKWARPQRSGRVGCEPWGPLP